MSDDKPSHQPALPNYLSFADDDDDSADATVELSLKDVFQFKAQDAREKTPAHSLAIPHTIPAPSAPVLSEDTDAEHTIQSAQGDQLLDLGELELIPLDDEDGLEEITGESIYTGDPTTTLDASQWRTQQPRPSQAPTRPAIQALQYPVDPDSTSAFEIPDTLLHQARTESAELVQRPVSSLKPPSPREDDATRAITFEELREAEAMAQDEAAQTSEMSVVSGQVLEFVAAVDDNMRLFVPRHLFEEGKLKPGMRLVITARIMP